MTEPAAAATAPAEPASLWEDFIDVLYAPARVFARRRGAGFGKPLFIIAILFGIISGATLPLTRPLMERQMDQQMAQMRRNGMSDEQVASARAMTERIGSITAVAGPVTGLLIVLPISAAVLWGVGRAFGGAFGYREAGLITVYSFVPGLLAALLGAALLLFLDAQSLPPLQAMTVGPVLFLGRDASPVVTALVSRFGVAEIWSIVITAAGLHVLARLSRGAAMGASIVMWVLGSIVALTFGLRAAAALGG